MMIRFFKHGTGSGRSAVEYLLAEEVPAFDEERNRVPGVVEKRSPLPEVLRGDPELTVELIDGIRRKWRYTSGVIAFAAEDAPTEAELADVMNGFERAAFAGLEGDQYDCLWVQHTHKGNVELHFVIPRMELYTGAAFNAAPPRSELYFNAFRDFWNASKGWASPSDPDRRRTFRHVLENNDRAEIRDAIRTHVIAKIELGKVSDHQDVLAALCELHDAGLEIKPPRPAKRAKKKPAEKVVVRKIGSVGTSETYRLTDPIFHEDWTVEKFNPGQHQGANRARDQARRKPNRRRAEELRRRLEASIARRADNIGKRYEGARGTHSLRSGDLAERCDFTGQGSGENRRRDIRTAQAVASQEAVALHSDADGYRGADGADRLDSGVPNGTSTDRDEDRDTAAQEWIGTVSQGDGAWRSGDGAGSPGGGGGEAMSTRDSREQGLCENTETGVSDEPADDADGARIAEIRRKVDEANRRVRASTEALGRTDRDGDARARGYFDRLYGALGRMSAAIGELVSSIGRRSRARWFCHEGLGRGAAAASGQAESPRLTPRPRIGPSGP